MVGEEAYDDGIAEEGALHTTAFDREVDVTDDQHVARPSTGRLGLCGFDRRFDIREFGFGGNDDDLFLGVELVVDGRLRHADGVSDQTRRSD